MRTAVETIPAMRSHSSGKTSDELLDEHRRMRKRAKADVKALSRRTEPPSFWAEFMKLLGRKTTR